MAGAAQGVRMPLNPYQQVSLESAQHHQTRKHLFGKIEKCPELGGRTLVTLFTTFGFTAQIDDNDADMLQSILQALNLANGLAVMISSPGGDGVAAERIVRVCRSYSGTKDFWAVIPGQAKSAATLVCMGASKILMAPASELGPVDPQITLIEDDTRKSFTAYGLVSGYDDLFKAANRAKGNIQPYLQQLANYDDREITKYRSYIRLSEDMAVKLLKSGMMKHKTVSQIRKAIRVFLEPEAGTHTHGRPIYDAEAESCGLNIEHVDVKSAFWKHVYELYVRTQRFANGSVADKAVESGNDGFYTPVPR